MRIGKGRRNDDGLCGNPLYIFLYVCKGGRFMKRKIFIAIVVVVIAWCLWQEGEVLFTSPEPVVTAGLTEPQKQPVYVYISGAVAKPGLYTFDEPVRVGEALEQAGKILAYGDNSAVNLAAPIADGDHIHIPYNLDGVPSGNTVDDGLISLNEADEGDLTELPGVGPSMAKKIIEHRQEHGPFTAVEDLQNVKGIGPAKFKQLQDKVKL